MQVLKSRIKVPTATELLLPPGLGGARYRIILLEETVRYRRLSRVTKQTIKRRMCLSLQLEHLVATRPESTDLPAP